MSRLGKKPLSIPKGVEVTVNGRMVAVKGSKGQLQDEMPADIAAAIAAGDEGLQEISFTPTGNPKQLSAQWGTARALVRNMIDGVTKGYTIPMKLIGVGYRATVNGKKLNMTLGYSHPIEVAIPEGVTVDVKDQTELTVSGIDKQRVGQFAAMVRSKRAPEPFKGKGVRYTNEHITMKEGKKK
jgi:large subunit ribosomal protein L6